MAAVCTLAKRVTAMCHTASAKKNVSAFRSPATIRNSLRCPPGRSFRSLRTGTCLLDQNAVSISRSLPACKTTAADVFGRHRNPDCLHACGPQDQIRRGACISPISPPQCALLGCTFNKFSKFSATKLWHGMLLKEKSQLLQLI